MTREELIDNIKICGQYLIDKSEELVVNHNDMADIVITLYPAEEGSYPKINIDTDYVPVDILEAYYKNKDV